jgi:hypothetical protein
MKNQLQALDEVINNFSEEEKLLMNTNQFAYIFSKAWVYLKVGPEKYRKRDAFQQPPIDFDEEQLQTLTAGCNQIINGIGLTSQKPFTNLDVSGFTDLFNLFHFENNSRKTDHKYTYNGKKGVLDCITFQHFMNDSQITYYNFCESIEKE